MEDDIWKLRKSFDDMVQEEEKLESEQAASEPKSSEDVSNFSSAISKQKEMGGLENNQEIATSLQLEHNNKTNTLEYPKRPVSLTLPMLKNLDVLVLNSEASQKPISKSSHDILINEKAPLCAAPVTGSAKECNQDVYSKDNGYLLQDKSCCISFHNISFTVEAPANRNGQARGGCGCLSRNKDKKLILNDVSGLFKSGMNAILGPTGSGKTTLLDILAGRKDKKSLSGHVLIDGGKQPNNFKCVSGYVIQDDIANGMLTVRENIAFSAALRLPSTVSQSRRTERVEEVIDELSLGKCADSRIGTELIRGVSGGERKRTCIAMEIITAPSVIFLDEPTTGLDAHTAYSVMHTLQRLAHSGKTVIFSIHQPRYSIFRLFDNLLLLSQGQSIYCGPSNQSLDYFSSIGLTCEEHNNPSDFFLDILMRGPLPRPLDVDRRKSAENDQVLRKLECEISVDQDQDEDLVIQRQRLFVRHFHHSQAYTNLQNNLRPLYLSYEDHDQTETETEASITYPTSFCKQMGVVAGRTFKNVVRNHRALSTQICSALILGLIVGTIYFQVDSSFSSGIQNRVGAFFFIVMNYVFGNMAAVDIFIKDRAVFIHENVSGFYRVSVYFLSKLVFDVVPIRGIPIVLFAAISYFMIGLKREAVKFLFFLLNTILTSVAGTSVALMFSASARVHSIGTILTSLVWVCMMVFSGLVVNVDTIPVWLQWMKWISIFHYSMNAYTVNELTNSTFFCDTNPQQNSTCDTGDSYMQRQGIPHESIWDLWLNEVALFIIALAFLVLTYIQLRRIPKVR